MYFCKIKVRLVPLEFRYFVLRRTLISSKVEQTVIPRPLLVSSPGFIIQIFLNSLSIFFIFF